MVFIDICISNPYTVSASNIIIDICDRPICLQGQLISWYLAILTAL